MGYWICNNWYPAIYGDDLPVRGAAARMVCGEAIVLWRGDAGEIWALEDFCPHRYAPLSRGDVVKGNRIRCGYHGLEFDGSGQCVHNPHGRGKIPSSAAPRAYPTLEYGGLIWLWMGNGDPDRSLLPDLSFFLPTSPFQQGGRGWLHMDVPYELVVDNLMDLSHASLLHDGILGNEQSIRAESEAGESESEVFARRWMPNIDPPEYLDLIWMNDGKKIDMWHDITWRPGASLLLDVGATEPGSTKEAGSGVYAQHLVTPVTDTSCMYFFMSARRNSPNHAPEERERIEARLLALRRQAFAEQDAPMIRAQYEAILRKGEYKPSILPGIDKATVLWRRKIERLIRDEDLAEANQATMRSE